jgi:hypothetical protein
MTHEMPCEGAPLRETGWVNELRPLCGHNDRTQVVTELWSMVY